MPKSRYREHSSPNERLIMLADRLDVLVEYDTESALARIAHPSDWSKEIVFYPSGHSVDVHDRPGTPRRMGAAVARHIVRKWAQQKEQA